MKVLITGGGGFIGSHLTASLLGLNQRVVVVDNFSTGHRANLDAARDWQVRQALVQRSAAAPLRSYLKHAG